MLPYYISPVFNLPSGPKNLAVLFPAVNWNNVASYQVELQDDEDVTILKTPVMEIGCCCVEDKVRIHFRNAMGLFDAVNFNSPYIVHDTTSGEFKQSLSSPLQKTDAAIQRFNIRSNDTYECATSCYPEEAQAWLMELADASIAFMEWKGTQGQADSYLPVRILDGKYEKKKVDNAFIYQFKIQFKMSNENILQQ